MPTCRCGADIPQERFRLGFYVCLDCGTRRARAESERKAKLAIPPGNKMGPQYLGDGASFRAALQENTKAGKQVGEPTKLIVYGQISKPIVPKAQRRVVGFVTRWSPSLQRRERRSIYEGDEIPPDMIKL